MRTNENGFRPPHNQLKAHTIRHINNGIQTQANGKVIIYGVMLISSVKVFDVLLECMSFEWDRTGEIARNEEKRKRERRMEK